MIKPSRGLTRKFLAISLMLLSAVFCAYLKLHPGWEFILTPSGFTQGDREGVYIYSLPSLAGLNDEAYTSHLDYLLLKHALRSSENRCEVFENGLPLTADAGLVGASEQIAPGKFQRSRRKLHLTSGDGSDPGENGKVYQLRLFRGISIIYCGWLFLGSLMILFYPILQKTSLFNDKDIITPAAKYTYLFILSFLLSEGARHFYLGFPLWHSWGELFINYEGGFVRRGLLGQLLFWADLVMPMPVCYAAFYTVIFGAFLYVVYKKLSAVFDRLVVAFIFLSPVIFLLPLWDNQIFGRKDLFVEIMLLGITLVCVKCLKKENASLCRNTLLICLLFIIGMLIHEMMIFYFPLFAVLLGLVYARQKKIVQWLGLVGVLFPVAALLFAVIFVGDVGQREAICQSWKRHYPELTCGGGLSYIGAYSFSISSNYYTNVITMGSTGLGAFLGGLPLIFLWKAYRPYGAIRELFSASRVLSLALIAAVAAPWLIMAIYCDYGRAVSIALISYLFFLYAVLAVRPQPPAPWLNRLKNRLSVSSHWSYAAYLFALLYGLGWYMRHVVPPGNSLVKLTFF